MTTTSLTGQPRVAELERRLVAARRAGHDAAERYCGATGLSTADRRRRAAAYEEAMRKQDRISYQLDLERSRRWSPGRDHV